MFDHSECWTSATNPILDLLLMLPGYELLKNFSDLGNASLCQAPVSSGSQLAPMVSGRENQKTVIFFAEIFGSCNNGLSVVESWLNHHASKRVFFKSENA